MEKIQLLIVNINGVGIISLSGYLIVKMQNYKTIRGRYLFENNLGKKMKEKEIILNLLNKYNSIGMENIKKKLKKLFVILSSVFSLVITKFLNNLSKKNEDLDLTNSMFIKIKKIKNGNNFLLKNVITRYSSNVKYKNQVSVKEEHPHIIEYDSSKNLLVYITCTSKKYLKVEGQSSVKNVYIGRQAGNKNKNCYISEVEIKDVSLMSEKEVMLDFDNLMQRGPIIEGNNFILLEKYIEKNFKMKITKNQNLMNLREQILDNNFINNKKD